MTTTTVTLPGGIRQTTTTRVLNVVFLPFMRSRKIFFKIEGLLPNMRHKPFFNGVDVSDWCREETFRRISDLTQDESLEVENSDTLTAHPEGSSSLISDSTGTIEGSFFLPNTSSLRFRAGRKEFKVLDWNAENERTSISKAFASYTSQGTLERRQTNITTILPPPPTPPVVVRRIDPIAQSFVIDSPEGAFITSVDVFMATKDTRVPLQVQIRTMENGLPTGAPIPGAAAFKAAADVNVSSSPNVNNAASLTNVAFDAPVYLNGQQEYALVLLAETDNYTAWTGVTTEYVVGSSVNRIMKQPSMGSFFKSQNGSTWTPDQSRDLMFRIKRASFGANSTGQAVFENQLRPFERIQGAETLSTGADPDVRIYCRNHGLRTSSRTRLKSDLTINGITLSSTSDLIVTDGDDQDSFVVNAAGQTSTASSYVSITNNFIRTAAQFNLMFANVNQMILPDTNVDWGVKTTTGRSLGGSENQFTKDSSYETFSPNSNVDFSEVKTVANERVEITNLSNQRSFAFKADLSTNSDYISPVIDLTRVSANLIENRIDRQSASSLANHNTPANYVAETNSVGGSSLAKHIFRPVTLEAPAIGLKALMGVNRPSDSFVELYYRTAEAGSDAPLETTDWVLASIDQEIGIDDDPNIFREYEYTIENLNDFNTFQFKIVFKSFNSANVPRILDFRAIALST